MLTIALSMPPQPSVIVYLLFLSHASNCWDDFLLPTRPVFPEFDLRMSAFDKTRCFWFLWTSAGRFCIHIAERLPLFYPLWWCSVWPGYPPTFDILDIFHTDKITRFRQHCHTLPLYYNCHILFRFGIAVIWKIAITLLMDYLYANCNNLKLFNSGYNHLSNSQGFPRRLTQRREWCLL